MRIKNIIIDTTAPLVSEGTPVAVIGNIAAPTYRFTSSEAGVITYGGDCSSATTTAVVGTNIVTFATLADGTHSNCTVRVTDAVGNASLPTERQHFTIDTQAPTISNVHATNIDGTYVTGSVIHVQLSFPENVSITGTPVLSLATGSPAVTAVGYAAARVAIP